MIKTERNKKIYSTALKLTAAVFIAVFAFGMFAAGGADFTKSAAAESSVEAFGDIAYDFSGSPAVSGYKSEDIYCGGNSNEEKARSAASAQAEWGGISTDSLWYYGSDYLDVVGVKEVLNKLDLTKADADNPLIIAVVDTGINTKHEIFEDVLAKTGDGQIRGYNSYNASKLPNPTAKQLGDITDNAHDSHGTAMASVAAMLIKELGLENYIKIYPIKASYTNGSNQEAFPIESVIEAIKFASEKIGASVINLSLGLLKSEMKVFDWSTNKELKAAIKAASQKCIITAAAGNESKDSSKDAFYPAYFDGVLSVMAYDKNKALHSTSDFGDYDIVAPGDDIYCAKNQIADKTTGYQRLSGTSLSSALAAGAAAVFKLMFKVQNATPDSGLEKMPSANDMSRLIRYENTTPIQKNGYNLTVFDFAVIMETGYNGEILRYSTPTGIFIDMENSADYEDYFIDDVLTLRMDEVSVWRFSAELTPYGETDPVYDKLIVWTVIIDGVEKLRYTGKNFSYKPAVGGEIEITAGINLGSTTSYSTSFTAKISYLDFLPGDVRVTTVREAEKDVDEAAQSGAAYTGETVTLALTGIQYVDRTNTIEWYVNGIKKGEGLTFDFSVEKSGVYLVSAKYIDGDKVHTIAADHYFTVNVKLRILSPLYMFSVITGGTLIITVAAVLTVMENKRKKLGIGL